MYPTFIVVYGTLHIMINIIQSGVEGAAQIYQVSDGGRDIQHKTLLLPQAGRRKINSNDNEMKHKFNETTNNKYKMLVQWDDDNTNELHDTVGSSFMVTIGEDSMATLTTTTTTTKSPSESYSHKRQHSQADKKWGKLIYHGRLKPNESVELDDGIQVTINTHLPVAINRLRQTTRGVQQEDELPGVKNHQRHKYNLYDLATTEPATVSARVDDEGGGEIKRERTKIYELAESFGTDWRPAASRSRVRARVSKALNNVRPSLTFFDNLLQNFTSSQSGWKPITVNKSQWLAQQANKRKKERRADELSGAGMQVILAEPEQIPPKSLLYHHLNLNHHQQEPISSHLEQPFDDDGILVLKHSLNFPPEAESRPKIVSEHNESHRWAPLMNPISSPPSTQNITRFSTQKSSTDFDFIYTLAQPTSAPSFMMAAANQSSHLSFREQLFKVYGNKMAPNSVEPDYWRTEAGSSLSLPLQSALLTMRPQNDFDNNSYLASLTKNQLQAHLSGSTKQKLVDADDEDIPEDGYQFIDHDKLEHQQMESELEEHYPRMSNPQVSGRPVTSQPLDEFGLPNLRRPKMLLHAPTTQPPILAHTIPSPEFSEMLGGYTTPFPSAGPLTKTDSSLSQLFDRAKLTIQDPPAASSIGSLTRMIQEEPLNLLPYHQNIQDTKSIRPLGQFTRQTGSYLMRPKPLKTTTYVTEYEEVPAFTTVTRTTKLKPASKTTVFYTNPKLHNHRSIALQRY